MRSVWLGVVLLAGVAAAEEPIYRWTDADGVVHYSNEKNLVPDPQKVETTSGEEIGVLPSQPRKPEPTREEAKGAREERVALAEVRRVEAEADRAEAEAKHVRELGEERWRAMFRAARERLVSLQAEHEETKSYLYVNGMPVTGRFISVGDPYRPYGYVPDPAYERAQLRLKRLEREIAQAKEELQELERRASFAEVPRHWRR